MVFYPLGLMSLASYLRENGFDNIELVDPMKPGEIDRLLALVDTQKPHIVGLSALSNDHVNMHHMSRYFRYHCPEALIVAGGAYPSSSREAVLDDSAIDLAVVGEGEGTFLEIVQRRVENKSLTHIPGTIFRDEKGCPVLAIPRPSLDIDSLPDPAWDMVDIEFYSSRSSTPVGQRRYMGLFTSRACPYKCTFCHDVFGKTFREISAKRMVSQIESLINDYDIYDFEFVDDIWNLNPKRLVEFCELVIEKKLSIRFHFPNGVRADLLTEEQLVLLKKAGLGIIFYAVETTDMMTQIKIKKKNRLDVINRILDISHRLDLYTGGFFMVGFPNETVWQMLKTSWCVLTSKLTNNLKDLKKEHALPNESNVFFYGTKNLSHVPQWLLILIRTVTMFLFHLNPFRVVRMIKIFREYNIEMKVLFRIREFINLIFIRTGRDGQEKRDNLCKFDVPTQSVNDPEVQLVGG